MFEREDRTKRYYLDAHGLDGDGVKLAVAWLTEFAREHGHSRASLFTPTLAQVDRLAEILGLNPSRLRKDGAFTVRGIRVQVASERQAQQRRLEGPVLGLWVDDRQLEKRLDGLDAPGLCVVPWNRVDIEQWKANWNPIELRSGEPPDQPATIANPVVETALESLTTSVNLSTGLSHPSDKSAAVQAFRVLRDGGEPFPPRRSRPGPCETGGNRKMPASSRRWPRRSWTAGPPGWTSPLAGGHPRPLAREGSIQPA